MTKLFRRRVPYHLEELKLIDLKTSIHCSEQLLSAMSQQCYIRNLTLTNVCFSDRSFDTLIRFLTDSKILRELELSWCEVRQSSYSKLMEALADNTQLHHLTLDWNFILEEKSQQQLNKQQTADGTKLTLSNTNSQTVENLCKFIRLNWCLVSVNLQNMRLIDPAIRKITKALKYALGVQSVNLTGNPGIAPDVIEFACSHL